MGMDDKKKTGFKWRLAISLDQLGNVLLGGSPDETISSRWGRMERDLGKNAPWYVKIGCYLLDKLDPGHCFDAIEFKNGKPDPHHLEIGDR